MQKVILAIALTMAVISAPASASDEQTLMFELGIGFGNASGGRTDGNDNAKWCKNRNTGRMVYGAIRYSYNDVEAHVARWFHNEEVANCDRDMWAVGVGYVLDTQGEGEAGTDDVYASWTPGFAYVWGDNTDYTGKDDNDGTNWRQTSNWQTFNRLAVGASDNDIAAEVAVHRYGTFNPEHGEHFVTVGLQLFNLDNAANTGDTDRDIGGNTTIINEGDTTIINIIDNTGGAPNTGSQTNSVDGIANQFEGIK